MICENHEKQSSFFARGCGKKSEKCKTQHTHLEGQVLPLKKVHCVFLETLYSSRDNQVRSQLACLYFMMQLQKIIDHDHKIPFHHDINHGKYAFRLDRTVDLEQNSFLCENLLLQGFPLRYEVLGHIGPVQPPL